MYRTHASYATRLPEISLFLILNHVIIQSVGEYIYGEDYLVTLLYVCKKVCKKIAHALLHSLSFCKKFDKRRPAQNIYLNKPSTSM